MPTGPPSGDSTSKKSSAMAAYCMAMAEAPGASPYPQVPAQPRYPSLEEQILAFWQADRTFEASVALHGPETEYVFYDGPPFANGLPSWKTNSVSRPEEQ